MSGQFSIIVAMDEQRGIGKDNCLPWHAPEDLAHFRALTTGHLVVMGRKTYESIGRPLPRRWNVVLTRDPSWGPFSKMRDDFYVFNSFAQVRQLPDMVPDRRVFVIGGSELYALALPYAHELIVTHVPGVFACDTFFPEFSAEQWSARAMREMPAASLGLNLRVVTYRRNTSPEIS